MYAANPFISQLSAHQCSTLSTSIIIRFNDRHGTYKSSMNQMCFLVWIHYVAASLWDLWEAGQVSLADSSPFAVCLFSQPHRRQIEPPVCSPLQSHQCNQTSAAINHQQWTLCSARCHTHTHPHIRKHNLSPQIQKNVCNILMHKDRFVRINKIWKYTKRNLLLHRLTHRHLVYAHTFKARRQQPSAGPPEVKVFCPSGLAQEGCLPAQGRF